MRATRRELPGHRDVLYGQMEATDARRRWTDHERVEPRVKLAASLWLATVPAADRRVVRLDGAAWFRWNCLLRPALLNSWAFNSQRAAENEDTATIRAFASAFDTSEPRQDS